MRPSLHYATHFYLTLQQGQMPYADPAKSRACAKKHYLEAKTDTQRTRLFKKLHGAFELNETERAAGVPPTSLHPIPKQKTLDKYGIQVTLRDDRTFVQIAAPAQVGNHAPPMDVTWVLPTALSTQVDQIKRSLTSLKDVAEATAKKNAAQFEKAVKESGTRNLTQAINDGTIFNWIQETHDNENTRKSYYYSFSVVVKHKLIPNITREAKKALETKLQQATDNIKLQQILAVVDGTQTTQMFSEIMNEATQKFDRVSEEMVLLKLYDEFTLRQDYEALAIRFHQPGRARWRSTTNYYVVPTGELVMNNLKKVKKKTDTFSGKVSESLKSLLVEYASKRGLEDGDLLFQSKPSRLFQNIGTSVNKLRHAKVTEMLQDDKLTQEQKRDLAIRMNHSIVTQFIYRRAAAQR